MLMLPTIDLTTGVLSHITAATIPTRPLGPVPTSWPEGDLTWLLGRMIEAYRSEGVKVVQVIVPIGCQAITYQVEI